MVIAICATTRPCRSQYRRAAASGTASGPRSASAGSIARRLECRQHAEQDGGQQLRCPRSECKRAPVDPNLRDPRQLRRSEREERLSARGPRGSPSTAPPTTAPPLQWRAGGGVGSRLAPIAARTENSRRRARPRASSRFATFTPATINISSTPPPSIRSAGPHVADDGVGKDLCMDDLVLGDARAARIPGAGSSARTVRSARRLFDREPGRNAHDQVPRHSGESRNHTAGTHASAVRG